MIGSATAEKMKIVIGYVLLVGLCAGQVPGLRAIEHRAWQQSQPVLKEKTILPTPTGPYQVGRASFHRIDKSRLEPFTPDQRDHRQVLFQIWYPAKSSDGAVAPYIDLLPDNDIFRRSYSFVGIDNLLATQGHATVGARVSDAKRRWPVIIFSHGLGMVSALYSTILENLASHGYFVVGVDSPFFSSALRLPEGTITKNESQRQREGAREEEAVVQAQDLIFVLNELFQLDKHDPEGHFNGRFDLRHVGVFGHSRGGFAAPHACWLDRRFAACLNLDGYPLTPAVMKNGIRQPYMHIEEIAPWEPPPTDEELEKAKQTRAQAIQEAQTAKDEREETFGRMSSGVFLVVVNGAKHMSFSDAPLISPDHYKDISIDASRALQITNAYVLAFFDRYLKSHKEPLLNEKTRKFPEVSLKIYKPGRRAGR